MVLIPKINLLPLFLLLPLSYFQLFCKAETSSNYYDVIIRQAVVDSYSNGGWNDIICYAELYSIEYELTETCPIWQATITITGCGPDFNCDGVVDLIDFQWFQQEYGE